MAKSRAKKEEGGGGGALLINLVAVTFLENDLFFSGLEQLHN